MKEKFTSELLAKARQVQSIAELIALAEEHEITLTQDEARDYFAQINEQHKKSGELSDDELSNVSGGGCHYKDGRMIVSVGCGKCECWKCKVCGREHVPLSPSLPTCTLKSIQHMYCDGCQAMQYEHGLWLCNSLYNMKKK
ncbi:MAG: bacteriocin [Oscillospiraceae bacterium]|nr:bacteriocin [Oscillospiraceae bacterium]